jgi:hypothetical protein
MAAVEAEPAEVPAAPAERKAFPWIWVGAGAIIVALAVGGYFAGHSGSSTKKSSSPGGISVEHATVGIPAGWHELKTIPKIPHLPLREAVGTAPSATSGLVMGMANLSYPWLLPSGLIGHEVVQKKTSYNSRPHIVGINGLQAMRTSGVAFSKSGKPLYTFIYFPQGKSATNMAVCYSKTGSVSDLLECEKVASQIKISGAKVYDLVPSKAYASSLSAALTTLSKAQQSGSQKLKSAKTTAAQAAAATQLASAYSAAGNTVKKLKATQYARPANTKVGAALGQIAAAYKSLASAAKAKSSSAYASASTKVTEAEQALDRAMTELESLGYSVG